MIKNHRFAAALRITATIRNWPAQIVALRSASLRSGQTSTIITTTKKVNFHPNPTSSIVNFINHGSLLKTMGNLIEFNVVGSKIIKRSFDDMRGSMTDLSNYPNRVYILNITVYDLKYQAQELRK